MYSIGGNLSEVFKLANSFVKKLIINPPIFCITYAVQHIHGILNCLIKKLSNTFWGRITKYIMLDKVSYYMLYYLVSQQS